MTYTSPDMTAPETDRPSPRLDPAAFTALLYLTLLAADLPLVGPLGAHDVLAPILVAFFLLRFREMGRLWHLPDLLLSGFGLLALLATLVHLNSAAEVYELAIFAYMGLLYLFFSRTRFEAGHLWTYGMVVGALMWLLGAYQLGAGGFAVHEAYRQSTLSFLVTRFRFTFDNPNLFGSFVALPLTCALIGLLDPEVPLPKGVLWKRLGWLALLFSVPIVLSASRHLLLSVGLVLAALPILLPLGKPRTVRLGAWIAFTAMAVLFYLTILVPFFPLRASPPFINATTPGMYTIHQATYARMVVLDPKAFFFGVGRSHVRVLYPALADPVAAYRILKQYNMEHMLEAFLSYMDAHCEYLNLATAFGVPAMLACYAFLVALARHVARRRPGAIGWMMMYAVAGICVISLWDDILSKRWIWVVLGLIASRAATRSTASAGEPAMHPESEAEASP